MKNLVFVTSNVGKVAEAKVRFSRLGYAVVQQDLGYPEIQADSLQEVAVYGVECVRQRLSSMFFLEDSGIFIAGLKGFPGVYSKYVFQTIGLPGVLRLMEGCVDRSAVFRSVIGYLEPGGVPRVFVGECPGVLSLEVRGSHGFGYDPIFVPDGWGKTFGEVSTVEKNVVSHRGKSLDLLAGFLKSL